MAYLELRLPGGSELWPLEGERLSIGRQAGNDVDLGHDDEASRTHALLERAGPGWMVRDLHSTGGTWVNGRRIAEGCALKNGDEIRIGRTRITYRVSAAEVGTPTAVRAPLPVLTPRERDVLVELCRPVFAGAVGGPSSASEIAKRLSVTPDAIRQILINLYDKFGIYQEPGKNRRVALAESAVTRGALTKPEIDAAVRLRTTRT